MAPLSLQAQRTGLFRDRGLGPRASPCAAACGWGGAPKPQRLWEAAQLSTCRGRPLVTGEPDQALARVPGAVRVAVPEAGHLKGRPLGARWAGEQGGRWFVGMGGPGRC